MKNPHRANTRINSPSYKQFVEVPHADIQRSTFDRSFGHKTTFDAGELIPIYADEMLPGDTFSCQLTAFARLRNTNTSNHGITHSWTHTSFSVPLRLIWDDFEEFMGETKTYTASGSARLDETPDFTVAAPVAPTITAGGSGEAEGSLADYLGVPTKQAGLVFSALWHRAYTLIWNDWFRDENLQKQATLDITSGTDSTAYAVLNRGKRHDYFTSALPWPQKGADVTLPLGTRAEIHAPVEHPDALAIFNDQQDDYSKMITNSTYLSANNGTTGDEANAIYADLSTATAATINQLRLAFATQKFLERQARSGSRYIEVIKGHFNVTSPDARLQRPQFLGGGSSPVNISPVAQTSSTDATTPTR